MSDKPKKKTSRRTSRRLAMQALYQWHFLPTESNEWVGEFLNHHPIENADPTFLRELLFGVVEHIEAIDAGLTPLLDRKIEDLNPVELAVMRLAMYELSYCPDTPHRVVINEALELTKEYGSEQGHKYVNAVLDRAAKKL